MVNVLQAAAYLLLPMAAGLWYGSSRRVGQEQERAGQRMVEQGERQAEAGQ